MPVKPGVRGCAMVGVYPPPMHGAAWVNRRVADYVRSTGVPVLEIDLAPYPGTTGWRARMSRPIRVAAAILRLLKGPRQIGSLDLSLAGGSGRWFDLIVLAFARLLRWRIAVHHHSFAYLDRPDLIGRLTARSVGSAGLHVALCEAMARRLAAVYPGAGTVIAVSNAVHLPPRPARARQHPGGKRPFTVGFLGNITRAKGVFDAFELGDRLAPHGVRLVVAGPIAEPAIAADVRQRGANHRLLGPVSGAAKASFFDGIDVLVFPTRYANEAEPVTVLEALREGLPVIAWRRGCLANLVAPDLLFEADSVGVIDRAAAAILTLSRNPIAFASASAESAGRFDGLAAQSAHNLAQLATFLRGPPAGDSAPEPARD